MGLLKPTLVKTTIFGAVEFAVIERYDEVAARAAVVGGMDDVLGEPFLPDTNADQIGDRTRPVATVKLQVTFESIRGEEQRQDGAGNDPESAAVLTVTEAEMVSKGLLANGVSKIRTNDRLIRLERPDGTTRADFVVGGLTGLFVMEVRPGKTGEATIKIFLESRRQASQ